MITSDLFFETYTAITTNKVRSGLTILGIVIGIASVIAMISIGRGAQSSIEESIQSIGSNLLMVRPGAQQGPGQQISQGQGSAQSLTLEDADALEKNISGIESVAPVISGNYQVVANGQNTRTSITGITSEYSSVRNVEMEGGAFISDQQNKSLSKVAVLGPDTRDELFGENVNTVGQKIRINGTDFTVIGVTKAKGGSGFGSEDDVIYIPLLVAKQYLSGDDSLSMINIKVENQSEMTAVQNQVTDTLLGRHGIKDPSSADFNVMNQADIVETASSVTGTFTILLGAVAGISLVVGGIGIMNMMLTTVTERTREIGLRKSIGAKRKDISSQFLMEAVTLTLIGGIIGVILGWSASLVMSKFFSISTEVSSLSVLLAFSVSAFIGIVFGYYPAYRAAKLNPIEALRYE